MVKRDQNIFTRAILRGSDYFTKDELRRQARRALDQRRPKLPGFREVLR